MARLNLLAPDYNVRFAKEGKGDKIKFLKIPQNLGKEALMSDINEGGVQFKECLEVWEKGLSRVVLIRCSNMEDGYMAVSYLAAMENERLGLNNICGMTRSEATESEESEDVCYEEIQDQEMEDLDSIDLDGEIYEDIDDEYYETPYRVPLLDISQLISHGDEYPGIFGGPMRLANANADNPKKPYWHSCVEQPICICLNSMYYCGGIQNLENAMDRFRGNRNVYIIIHDMALGDKYDEEEASYFKDIHDDSGICTFVLEHTADFLEVYSDEEELEKYRMTQFDNWLKELGVRLEKNFPKKTMVKRILNITRPSKSELMSLVLKYVIKNKKSTSNILTKDDFSLLSKFKAIGLVDKDRENSKSSERLEKELVGMDNVKRQVREIVNLMNYNRNREEMGFGKSNYHNVHLLIGAPGTAKTTVAKLMGNMMCEQKLITGNRFISVNGADLKGMYVGHSAPKTKALFRDYDIILIDEAYSLMTEGEGSDSFSQEAMAQLIIEIEEHAMDKLVFFAGYGGMDVSEKDNRMKRFIDGNPGLKSRINSTIYFQSYTPDEMVEILHCQANNFKYKIDRRADIFVRNYFAKRVKDTNFGNGREARSLLENATLFAANRVMRMPENKRTKKVYETITLDDVKMAIERLDSSNMFQTGRKNRICGFA